MTEAPESNSKERTARTGPMQAALNAELARLELTAVRADMVGAVVAALASLLAWASAGSAAAPIIGGWAALAFTVFVLEHRALTAGRGARVFQWINPFIEISAPTVILATTAVFVSADAALTSSPAIVGYAVPMAVAVLRLRPVLPVLVGLVGALQYVLFVHVILMPRLSETLLGSGSVRVTLVYANGAVILAAGGVASLVTLALRRAVGAAHREVRSHDLFGKYRLGEPLAEGGMGVVLRATYCPEGGFERSVAIKRIHPHLARDERFVSAFRNEAALCARLTHPNIVQVLDFGLLEDTYFFAMEFVDGWSLSQLMAMASAAGIPLPLSLVAHVGREVCAGLVFAQEQACDADGSPLRVVHRDLSPSNVLVARTGQVKVADFGIAKALRSAEGTRTKTVQGKMAYMAPEQARAEVVDVRSDVFALGAVLWEMLAGRPVFRRANDAATLLALLQEPVSPPSAVATRPISPEWDHLVGRALERDPARRWSSASEMMEGLEALVDQHPLRPTEMARFVAGLDVATGQDTAPATASKVGGTLLDAATPRPVA